MIYFRPCHADHVRLIEAQDAQASEKALNTDVAAELVEASLALSAWHNALCVGAFGVRAVWGGRAVAWALLSVRVRPAMPAIVRRLRFALDANPAQRVEMTVRADLPQGRRLAEMLGFQCETPNGMSYFFPDGCAGYLYARVK